MKRWKIVLLCVALAIVGVVIYGGFLVHRILHTDLPNAYAVEWVAELVVQHMDANDGAWPRDWDELRDDYQTLTEDLGSTWSFEELQSRVAIDWQADPATLIDQASATVDVPFNVIWLQDGSSDHWVGREPNQVVLDYLLQKRDAPDEISLEP